MCATNTSIQEHPEITNLKQLIAEAKTRIIDVLATIDDIRLQQNPIIESEYALKIGCYENELLKAEIAQLRARRKLTLAQKALNAGEKVNERAIEGQLDQEFAAWQQRLAAAMEHYQMMLDERNSRQALSETDSKELGKLYRKIVKRLHPDINPKTGEQEQRLFLAAQIAYHNGDLTALRAIAVTVDGLGEAMKSYPEAADLLEFLEVELSLQRTTSEVLADRLDKLKQEFPYTMAAKLADRDWLLTTIQQLKERTEQHRANERIYTTHLSELLNDSR
jgi:uncharacterized protein YukE